MEFLPGAFEHEWERRKAVLLQERQRLKANPIDEEERRRRGGSVATASPLSGRALGRTVFGKAGGGSGRGHARGQGGEPSMRSRFWALPPAASRPW